MRLLAHRRSFLKISPFLLRQSVLCDCSRVSQTKPNVTMMHTIDDLSLNHVVKFVSTPLYVGESQRRVGAVNHL